MPDRKAVLITGMQRSGTALVARILQAAGLELGPDEELYPGDAVETEGDWGNQRVMQLHDELLERRGGSWESPPEAPWHPDDAVRDLKLRAAAVVDELARGTAWGWKDANGSFALPLWLDVVPDAQVLLCVRNPADVAASLARRSHLSRSFCLRLWQQYNEQVLADAPPDQLVVTHFESWLTDPQLELRRVATALRLETTKEARSTATAMVRLDHGRRMPPGALPLPPSPPGLLSLYERLCDLAGVDVPTDTRLAAKLEADAIEAMAGLQAQLTRAEAEVARLQGELQHERVTVTQRDAALQELRSLLRAAPPAAGRTVVPARSETTTVARPSATAQAGTSTGLAAAVEERRRRRSEYTTVKAGLREVVERLVPPGGTVAVVSRGDDELLALGPRRAWHFPATEDGTWAGSYPEDDVEAVDQLEAMRSKGAGYLAIPSTSGWWLDHYAGLASHLHERYALLHRDERCALFELADVADRRPLDPALLHIERPTIEWSPATDVELVRASGLFDEAFYVSEYPTASIGDLSPIEHFCAHGWCEAKQPNAYFDTDWYRRTHQLDDTNPLVDYLESGETRQPCALFDPVFYAEKYLGGVTTGALADFLDHMGRGLWRDPNHLFDVAFYVGENPDVLEAGVDPVLHYIHQGHLEGRNPSEEFLTDYYRRAHLAGEMGRNPLVHYFEAGRAAGLSTHPADEGKLHAEVRRFVSPGEHYEDPDPSIATTGQPRVKALAFYLPQFHAFPENDEWWGTGFTEWRNVARGTPRFKGHYQPRIPRDLGFYDLSDPRTMPRQVELARNAGLHGFAFYYYWFNGKRLLDQPLDRFLDDPSLDLNFCLIWANENWTRRWDGQDQEVLMRQDYAEESDVALVDDLQRYFADPRYIRIDGRPLFVIYRVDIIPGGALAIERWRTIWRERHGEDPLIFIAQTFGTDDPRPYGGDGAVEFPPHKLTNATRAINEQVEILDPALTGWVYDYVDCVAASIEEPHPEYPLIKTALPSWDNDARRQGSGVTLHGSTPAVYEAWLSQLASNAEQHPVFGESFVFINAWNEWAEAAYLEPDVHFGAAYLNATARALVGGAPPAEPKRKVLLVGHDAHPFGAQINLWHMGETIRNQFGCEVGFLLGAGGDMLDAYQRLGETMVAEGRNVEELVDAFEARGFDIALVNTVASGSFVRPLKLAGFRVVSLVHELPRTIDAYGLTDALAMVVEHSDHIVVAAGVVADGLAEVVDGPVDRLVLRPQGVYRPVEPSEHDRAAVRAQLGIPSDHRVVLNVGSGDLRKGVDIFTHVARMTLQRDDRVHFVWVGKPNNDVMRWMRLDLGHDVRSRLHFVDFTDDVAPYYSAADVFFMASREDPFPSVVLEAMTAGLPVVAFAGCTGTEDLVRQHGRVVEELDLGAAVTAILDCTEESDPDAVAARRAAIAQEYRFDDYCFELLQLLDPTLRKVSVVVPNFNYRNHLARRLDSVFRQSYPVFEVLVLDDGSDDGSLAELEVLRQRTGRQFEIRANETNSGSVFEQWRRGSAEARGDYLWIAEADDLSRPEFLERLVPLIDESKAGFGFVDSATIDQHGRPLDDSYVDYYRQVVGTLLDDDLVMDGPDFVRRCLAVRNLVLNVSAVVWRRDTLVEAIACSLDELRDYRLAGDWYLYVQAALASPTVAYVADQLNIHRRHEGSVTASLQVERHLDEVRRVHEAIRARIDLDDSERDEMARYVGVLATQFGLDEPELEVPQP